MGYEPGKGLGKEGQGIVLPVEAFKRKGRAALGSYGPERTKNAEEVSKAQFRHHASAMPNLIQPQKQGRSMASELNF